MPESPRRPRSLPSDRFVRVAERLVAPTLLLSKTGVITYVNPATESLFRQQSRWLIGRTVEDFLHEGDRLPLRRTLRAVGKGEPSGRSGAFRVRAHPALEWRIIEWTADNLLDDPDVGAILVSLHDVTGVRAETATLADLAFHDGLTGLPNRNRLVEELSRLLATDGPVSIGLASIDRLDLVEDSLGPVGAEALIAGMAKRVRAAVPASSFVGRVEGGSFVILMAGAVARDAEALGWRLVEQVRAPLFVGSREVLPNLSIGIAIREPTATPDSLLWDAGVALHRAQSLGGGQVAVFSNGHRQATIARLELEADLRHALQAGELALALQPLVHLADRRVVASEALLRWHHPKGQLQPSDFIPLAEETGLIVPIGEWVVAESSRLASLAPGGRVSVNLSPRQLAVPGLPGIIDRLVSRQADRSRVEFEITETLLIEQWTYTAGVLSEIRRLGFRVGLDDFGTGYSSLAYLRRLPIDYLKIDRSLVADIDASPEARPVVGAVVAMAKALGLEVVAEGVERESQVQVLLELGAETAQGYLFGMPEELGSERSSPRSPQEGS